MVKSSNIFDSSAYIIPTPVNGNKFITRIEHSFVSYKFYALNMISKLSSKFVISKMGTYYLQTASSSKILSIFAWYFFCTEIFTKCQEHSVTAILNSNFSFYSPTEKIKQQYDMEVNDDERQKISHIPAAPDTAAGILQTVYL